ncbi:MAG: hypothetical protein HYU99_04345, partial [Deltaproteobacteria bacterium]|nr:hypothetical protein [Deltaproteobacteria bacterium]
YLVTAQAIREAAEELGLPEPEIGGPYTALLLGPIVETDEDEQPILDEDGNEKTILASAWFVKLVEECAVGDPLPWFCGGVRPNSWRDYVNFISSEHYYWNRWDELQNPPQYDFEEFDTKLQVDILLADFEAEGIEGLTSADIRLDPIGGNFTRFGTEFGEQASSGAALFVNQLIQLARMVDEGEELKGAAFYSAFALTDYIPPDENGPFDDGFWSPAFAGDSNWWTEPYYEDKYMTPSGTAFHLVNQFVADDVEVLPIPSGSRAFQLMLGRDMPGESILLLAANYDNAPASVDLNVQNLPLGQWVLDEAYQVDETARPLAELPNFRDLPADPPRIENGTVHFRIPPFGVRYLRFRRTNYIIDPIEE